MARFSILIAPLAGLVISIGLLFNTRGFAEVARGDQLGPGFWPRLVLAEASDSRVSPSSSSIGARRCGG